MEIKSFLIWTILTGCLDCMIRGHSSSLCLVPHNASHNNGYSSVCMTGSEELVCERGKVIMITNIEFAKTATIDGNIKCNECSRHSVSDLEIRPTMFLAKLYQACSLHNQCKLEEDVMNPEAGKSEYVWFADITYNCVESALFMDICSFIFEQCDGPASLHITLNQAAPDKVMFVSCTCIVNGDIRLVAVDYRPYINDLECASTAALYIDGKQMFRCLDVSSGDFSVYNEEVHVTSNITNITMTLDGPPPRMLWMQITGSSGVSLVCDQNIYDSDQQTSMFTSTAMSVTTASPSVTDNVTDSGKQTGSSGDFPTSVVVGTAVGLTTLVIVVITAVILYRRWLCKRPEFKGSEVLYYNQASLKAVDVEESRTNGGTDTSNDNRDGLNANTSDLSPNGQDKDSNTGYIIMNVGHLKRATSQSKNETNTCTKQQTDDRGATHRETYFDNLLTVDNERGSNYSNLDNNDVHKHDYYNLVSSDDYQNI